MSIPAAPHAAKPRRTFAQWALSLLAVGALLPGQKAAARAVNSAQSFDISVRFRAAENREVLQLFAAAGQASFHEHFQASGPASAGDGPSARATIKPVGVTPDGKINLQYSLFSRLPPTVPSGSRTLARTGTLAVEPGVARWVGFIEEADGRMLWAEISATPA